MLVIIEIIMIGTYIIINCSWYTYIGSDLQYTHNSLDDTRVNPTTGPIGKKLILYNYYCCITGNGSLISD